MLCVRPLPRRHPISFFIRKTSTQSVPILSIGMNHYVYLAIAILSEVLGTSALKASNNFTRLAPSVLVVLGYGTAFYFLSLVLRTMPIGIAYAIWSGVGITLLAIIGLVFYQQSLDLPAVIGMLLIISGVLVLNLFSKTVSH
jgi:small multidrug resistance pump